jgi:hypothetical protein
MPSLMFVPFIDIISANAAKAPFVKGGIRAYYATGSSYIEETAAQIAAARAAGMSIILIDQTPSLSVFAAGLADIADVEPYAGTDSAAHRAVAQRQTHGWESTLYVSYDNLPALKADIASPAGVWYGVADYNWSQAESEALIGEHPDWAYCQYGDNISNAMTLVPGTNVTCGHAACDIDIARGSWAAQFLPKQPPKPLQQPWWHVADGKQSLEQIAAARGTTAAHLRQVTMTAVGGELAAVPLKPGTRYATSNP